VVRYTLWYTKQKRWHIHILKYHASTRDTTIADDTRADLMDLRSATMHMLAPILGDPMCPRKASAKDAELDASFV
jgi:hypothetical protein